VGWIQHFRWALADAGVELGEGSNLPERSYAALSDIFDRDQEFDLIHCVDIAGSQSQRAFLLVRDVTACLMVFTSPRTPRS
jgi:hypothetical protein